MTQSIRLKWGYISGMCIKECEDDRTHIKKAISWALRAIAKRNDELKEIVLQTVSTLQKNSSTSATWIAKDVLRRL